jgi:integrase
MACTRFTLPGDLTEKVWTLPAARAKNGVEHIIPLSDAAVSILENMPHIGRRDGFVFPMTGRTPISGWSKAKTQLDKASGITGWTIRLAPYFCDRTGWVDGRAARG